MSNEDKMAMKLVEMADDIRRVEFEKHYNHYGSRGVADLYIQEEWDGRRDTVYEIKSDAAIESSTGANEIVRQFNRMCEYFYAGANVGYPPRRNMPCAELTFVASDFAFQHLMDNYAIYESIDGTTLNAAKGNVKRQVVVRSLGEVTAPYIAFHENMGLKSEGESNWQNTQVLEDAGIDKSLVEQ